MIVCRCCGQVERYDLVFGEYVDFNENRHLFHRKSVYDRKYHVKNVLIKLCEDLDLSFPIRDEVIMVYKAIGENLRV